MTGEASMAKVSATRRNLLRAAHLVLVVGPGIFIWPIILDPSKPMASMGGVVVCMLGAMSALALLGLRNPLNMLPNTALRNRLEDDLASPRRPAAVAGWSARPGDDREVLRMYPCGDFRRDNPVGSCLANIRGGWALTDGRPRATCLTFPPLSPRCPPRPAGPIAWDSPVVRPRQSVLGPLFAWGPA